MASHYPQPDMPTDVFALSKFQFSNLIENRVPFTLIHFQVNFESIYRGLPLLHIQKIALAAPASKDFLPWIESLGFSQEQALVLVCTSGSESKLWARKLAELGYINVFYYSTLTQSP